MNIIKPIPSKGSEIPLDDDRLNLELNLEPAVKMKSRYAAAIPEDNDIESMYDEDDDYSDINISDEDFDSPYSDQH